MRNRDERGIFAEPVDILGYTDFIRYPMDLTKIKLKMIAGLYPHVEDISDDIVLMLNNCLQYNGKDTSYYKVKILI